jgi:hypothetical protein
VYEGTAWRPVSMGVFRDGDIMNSFPSWGKVAA